MQFIFKKAYLVLCIFISAQTFCHADAMVLTAPPRESAQAGEQLYGPLARHLSELTGHQVKYRHPGNWLRYQRDMRRNQFDVVFDGPHFASWRIAHSGHQAVARLPGILKFYLVARAEDDSIKIPRDLAAKKVCVIPPPNLSSLVLLARTDGPAREPILEGIKGGMKNVHKGLIEDKCEAAMLRSAYFDKKLDEAQRAQLKIIFASPEMPNQVITIGDRFSPQQVQQISASLISGEGVAATENILRRFGGKKVKSFIAVTEGEFNDYNELLEGVILGWKKRSN